MILSGFTCMKGPIPSRICLLVRLELNAGLYVGACADAGKVS